MTLQLDIATRFQDFLTTLPHALQTRIHILTDSDADGLPAAALLVRALHAAGYGNTTAEVRLKHESAWNPHVLDRIRARNPEALLLTDLGSRPDPLLPGVPTLLLDHHAPTGTPPGATLLTGYGTAPIAPDGTSNQKEIPTTGLLAFWCALAIAPAEAPAWLWLAAISLLSDLGDKAPFPELTLAKKQFGGGALRDCTSLLNAPRRTSVGDATSALALLLAADSPKDLLSGRHPEFAHLQAAKAEVAEALAAARKLPPRFSTKVRDELGADLVAIPMHTPCQVHPLVAQQWRARFPRSVIFGVNTGFHPGWVHFSGRAPASVNLINFLRAHRPPEADSRYGNGHDQAAGGALPTPVWNRFATDLGFGPELQVPEDSAAEPSHAIDLESPSS